MSRLRISARCAGPMILLAFALAALVALAFPARGQGTLTFVQTGGGTPLVSATVPLVLPGSAPGVVLAFQFGFSTQETPAPGIFSDAVTAALLGTNNLFLPLATADASGTVWAPGGQGTVPIAEAEIIRQAISYPSAAPAYAFQQAWSVNLLVPQAFPPGPLTFYFDLFDNNNAMASVAWFTGLTLTAIPEPEAGVLALLGVGLLWHFRRRTK